MILLGEKRLLLPASPLCHIETFYIKIEINVKFSLETKWRDNR